MYRQLARPNAVPHPVWSATCTLPGGPHLEAALEELSSFLQLPLLQGDHAEGVCDAPVPGVQFLEAQQERACLIGLADVDQKLGVRVLEVPICGVEQERGAVYFEGVVEVGGAGVRAGKQQPRMRVGLVEVYRTLEERPPLACRARPVVTSSHSTAKQL